jgi:hypothetical protein
MAELRAKRPDGVEAARVIMCGRSVCEMVVTDGSEAEHPVWREKREVVLNNK